MQTKYDVVSKLINGVAPKDISTELEVPYTKVLRIKREYEDALANNTVSAFIDMDKVMMDDLMDKAVASVPAELQDEANEAVANIKAAKTALDMLSDDMLITAKTITTRIKSMVPNVEHISELEGLTSALCDLQTAFFNSNKTQVNVQNNYGDAGSTQSAYGEYLND